MSMHIEQWNQPNCVPPPVSTSKIEVAVLPEGREYLQKTCKRLEEAIEQLKSPAGSELLQTELYLIKRFHYKGACSFRRFRITRTLRQLRNCLTRLMDLNICKSFEDYLDVWPRSTVGEDVYLPRKEMLQFLLVRLMGGAKLLMQTCAYCHHGFEEVMFNLRLGMLAPQMLVFQACFARVWALCNSLRKRFEEWYDVLMELSHHAPEAETEWLQVAIPNKLSDWLPPDPDLPRDGDMSLQSAAEKSDALSVSAAKLMLKDWKEDDTLPETETLKIEAEDLNEESPTKESLVQEVVVNDDLGSPFSRKRGMELDNMEAEEGTSQHVPDGDDLGSPVSREIQISPNDDSGKQNRGSRQRNKVDSKKQKMKSKMKKQKKEKLMKKLLSDILGPDEPETSDDGHLNGSNQEQPRDSEKNKKRKRAKLKKLLCEMNISMKSEEGVNLGQLENTSPSTFSVKKKKKKLMECGDVDDNHNQTVVSKKLKKNQMEKKLNISMESEVPDIKQSENSSPNTSVKKKKQKVAECDVNDNRNQTVVPKKLKKGKVTKKLKSHKSNVNSKEGHHLSGAKKTKPPKAKKKMLKKFFMHT